MTASLEVTLIDRLAAAFPRAPGQLNARHESDAELVSIPGGAVLAATTDGVIEEIETGLYDDPELAGWMAVMVNASDLAAVGADPVGMLISETLPHQADESFVAAVQRGIAAAAARCGLPILGGDTNASDRFHLTGTALGIIADGKPLTRRGTARGETLMASGPLGLGSAFAFAKLTASRTWVPFKPVARLKEGRLLRDYATACMDTSDGVLPTLHELGRLNGVGFHITLPDSRLLDAAALATAAAAHLPPWLMLAGPHGEFELLFTVTQMRIAPLLDAAAGIGWHPIVVGTVTADHGVVMKGGEEDFAVDPGQVRNLFGECGGDVERYVRALLALPVPLQAAAAL